MEISRVVECRVMKGLGPEWTDKTISIFFDDLPNDMADCEIRDMVIAEARLMLRRMGYRRYIIGEINKD